MTNTITKTSKYLAPQWIKLNFEGHLFSSTFSHKFTLEKASVSEKKAYPIRWLIVAVSTISAFLFAIILLLIFEKLKELKRQES
mgnify:CR=1 FL=1